MNNKHQTNINKNQTTLDLLASYGWINIGSMHYGMLYFNIFYIYIYILYYIHCVYIPVHIIIYNIQVSLWIYSVSSTLWFVDRCWQMFFQIFENRQAHYNPPASAPPCKLFPKSLSTEGGSPMTLPQRHSPGGSMRDLLSGEIVAWHDYWSPPARYRPLVAQVIPSICSPGILQIQIRSGWYIMFIATVSMKYIFKSVVSIQVTFCWMAEAPISSPRSAAVALWDLWGCGGLLGDSDLEPGG